MLDLKSLYWAAGFLEGEGTFNFSYRKNSVSNDFRVVASQVEIEPLEKLMKLFGGKIHRVNNNRGFKGCGYIYTWQTYGTRARGIAMTIYSLMSNKRQKQIQAMLSHQWYTQMRKNGRFISPREVI